MENYSWFIKHRPIKFTEILCSDDTHFQALKWLKQCKNGGILHISGDYGIGKTSLALAVAKIFKYNVLNLSDINFEHLQVLKKSQSFYNCKNLLLVDENDLPNLGFIKKLASLNIPVIILSQSLYLREYYTLKLKQLSKENILIYIKKILEKEGSYLEPKVIFKLCELCNHDLRSITNYCQLLRNNPQLTDMKILSRLASSNIFRSCKTILSKRLNFLDLESLYSPKIASLCRNSVLENCSSSQTYSALISASEISLLPEKYQFLTLNAINQTSSDFIYKKDEVVMVSLKKGHEDVLNYLQLYKRDLQNMARIIHLQTIFEMYDIQNLSDIDIQIKNFINFNSIKVPEFKYKYNLGSSAAIKRDVSLKEVLEF